MGWPIGHYTCSKCKGRQTLGIPRNRRYYELDHETQVNMRLTAAWCLDCACLQHAENLSLANPLDDLRRLARSLASVSVRRSWFRTVWSCLSFHRLDDERTRLKELTPAQVRQMGKEIDRLRQQIGYLDGRTAPARCLTCGGHRIQLAELVDVGDLAGYLHPSCGGVLTYEVTGSMNLGPKTVQHVHGPDGAWLRDEPFVRDEDAVSLM